MTYDASTRGISGERYLDASNNVESMYLEKIKDVPNKAAERSEIN